jgi:hypothetical protein
MTRTLVVLVQRSDVAGAFVYDFLAIFAFAEKGRCR